MGVVSSQVSCQPQGTDWQSPRVQSPQARGLSETGVESEELAGKADQEGTSWGYRVSVCQVSSQVWSQSVPVQEHLVPSRWQLHSVHYFSNLLQGLTGPEPLAVKLGATATLSPGAKDPDQLSSVGGTLKCCAVMCPVLCCL